MISVTRQPLPVPFLPEALGGLRVAHLTDLHRSRFTSDRLLHRAVALANAEEPDLTLLTGDFVTADPADIEPCAHLLAPLRARLGVYAVLGNHDYTADAHKMRRALTHCGIHVLINSRVKLAGALWVVGLDDDRHGRPDITRAFANIGRCEPTLALIHNPGAAEMVAERHCVVFSGHTHGGQVRLPLLTAWKVRQIGAGAYRAGWYTIGKSRVYVNRGIGRVGLPLRLACKPEIALFTLEPAKK